MVNISPLLAWTVIVVTVSTLSILCVPFMPNPKNGRTLTVSGYACPVFKSKRGLELTFIWSGVTSHCEIRTFIVSCGDIDNLLLSWARRWIEGHVGSFVVIIFNANNFSCLLSTDIRTLVTSRRTKHLLSESELVLKVPYGKDNKIAPLAFWAVAANDVTALLTNDK